MELAADGGELVGRLLVAAHGVATHGVGRTDCARGSYAVVAASAREFANGRGVLLKQLHDKVLVGLDEEGDDVLAQGVAVLVEEAVDEVRDEAGIVLDRKRVVAELGLLEILVLLVVVDKLFQQRLVAGLGEIALLVQEPNETDGFLTRPVDFSTRKTVCITLEMRSMQSWLSTKGIFSQSMPSLLYSSCSSLKMCWLK